MNLPLHKIFFTFYILNSICLKTFAQDAGMEGINIRGINGTDPASVVCNPGAGSETGKVTASAFFQKPFMADNLRTEGFFVSLPALYHIQATAGYCITGFSSYNTGFAITAVNMNLSARLKAGIAMIYRFTQSQAENFTDKDRMEASVGVNYQLNKTLTMGASVTRIEGFMKKPKEFPENHEEIMLGMKITVSDQVTCYVESFGPGINFSGGVCYQPKKFIWLMTGYSVNNTSVSFGAGYLINKIKVCISSKIHPVLGITPSAGLSYEFK